MKSNPVAKHMNSFNSSAIIPHKHVSLLEDTLDRKMKEGVFLGLDFSGKDDYNCLNDVGCSNLNVED